MSTPDPIAQCPETGMIDTPGPQGKPVVTFYDFELVARANPQSVQHPSWQGDLAF